MAALANCVAFCTQTLYGQRFLAPLLVLVNGQASNTPQLISSSQATVRWRSFPVLVSLISLCSACCLLGNAYSSKSIIQLNLVCAGLARSSP